MGRRIFVRRKRKPIPMLDEGKLGGRGFFKKPTSARRKILVGEAKKVGEQKVVGRLRAIQVLTKNTSPMVSMKAGADARFIAGSFKGKKRVRTGTGFSRIVRRRRR